MNTLLVINIGSSSLKFAVFRGRQEVLCGLIDDIGSDPLPVSPNGRQRLTTGVSAKTIVAAMKRCGLILEQHHLRPTAVAHRIVHGGGVFWRPTVLTTKVIKRLKEITPLAPLHMPLNLLGVTTAQKMWPGVKEIAVFDTAAFHDLPQEVETYALPLAVTKKFHIRKYGFHGISHRFALEQAARQVHKPVSRMNAVTIHLGAGDSIALWERGRAMDTSMGFTPLEGLTMSTRSGDLDPSIPLFLVEHGLSAKQVEDILERRSGLFGLTGLSDMRDILSAAGHPVAGWPRHQWSAKQRRQAQLAVAMFVYDIQRYLGSYLGRLDRCDAIVFTGSIGRNAYLQNQILRLPATRRIRHLTIPTDEERAIATALGRVVH